MAARPYGDRASGASELKKAGNEIMRAPRRTRDPSDQRARRRLLPRPERPSSRPLRRAAGVGARVRARRRCAGSRFEFPDFERDYEFVALRHPDDTRSSEGRIVSNRGPRHRGRAIRRPLRRGARRALQRAALASARARRLSGRPARALRLNFDQLSPLAREAAREAGLGAAAATRSAASSCARSSWSTPATRRSDHRRLRAAGPARGRVARARATATADRSPARDPLPRLRDRRPTATILDARDRAAHLPEPARYRGRSARAVVDPLLELPDESCALRCEQAIRNYDPCISCATHFLQLTVERGPSRAAVLVSGSAISCAATTAPGSRWRAGSGSSWTRGRLPCSSSTARRSGSSSSGTATAPR